MKISDSKPAASTRPVSKPDKSDSATPKPSAIDDEITLSGIPESELTENVRKVLTALLVEVQDLRRAVAASQARIAELEVVADRDPLVDALNRRAFVRELDRTLAMRERYRIPSCLVFIDLNDLKKINDSYGHSAGDKALQAIAKVVTNHTRQTDILGRLGGDEFGLILSHIDKDAATKKITELENLIETSIIEHDDNSFGISVALGLVELSTDMSAEHAIKNADIAMYQKKNRK